MNEEIKNYFDLHSASWDEAEVSTEEERRAFLSFIDIKEGDKVLDLGCGTGVITRLLLEKAKREVIGLDLSPKMIEIAKKKAEMQPLLNFQSGDFLDFKEGDFDWIIVFNAYPHFLDRESFKKKALSLLDKGGKLVIAHNIGRVVLAKHHSGSVNIYSRDLLPPKEEANFFFPEMKIILSDETKDSYRIILEKL